MGASPAISPAAAVTAPGNDPLALRRALGRFATGVTVMTTRDGAGRPQGLTVNSFASLSLDPPLVLWSIGLAQPSRPAFDAGRRFAVNVLSEQQVALSKRFSRSAEDKFAGLEWQDGLGQVPLLPGCLATFECIATVQYDGGDHRLIVGRVERFRHAEGRPLLFFAGSYGAVDDHPATV